jgi:hypothetical protein
VWVIVSLLHKTHLRLCDLNCYPQAITSIRRLRLRVLCCLSCWYVHITICVEQSPFFGVYLTTLSVYQAV